MALIIKGKMPTCCGSCRASGTDVCKSWFGFLKHMGEGRPIGCPIIGEIPDKHGDLIDEDEFRLVIYREIRNHKKDEPITMILKGILWEMDNAPVIVEGSE